MSEDKTLNEQPTPRPPTKSLESLHASISPPADTKVGTRRTRDFYFLPIPSRLQYDPDKPPPWGMYLNIIFASATTIFVANLYYCQPILIQLSQSLNVSYNQVSNVPTLIQAGYATGLLLIAPLGDLVLRRPLVLLLCFATTALTFGLAFTTGFIVFEVISFILGVVTCVSQVLAPLTADLAPERRRASALSILTAGVLLGILWARVMAGLIAQFVSWRVVYYTAIGIQAAITFVLYWTLPDYPVKNTGLTYGKILFTMAKYTVTEPLLVQASLVSMVSMACFTNFWVTLTFLLGGPPYNYSTLVIGLFGLVGVLGVFAAPLVGRTIDHLVPWFATVIATIGLIIFQAIQTGAGGINIGAVVVVCFGLDVFRQYQQVSLTTAVFGIEPTARSRLNAVVWLSVFVGQIMGTSVGTQVFIKYGWRPAAALSIAWSGFTLFIMLMRGPHCKRYTWFGYEGGLELRKSRLPSSSSSPSSQESQPQRSDPEKGPLEATSYSRAAL
ncbi:major facilitator superfamily domain-containing protein [Irpex rosettiformis]|uniref:Major facilitator superfamily domain-containing protein n=1 Tax=Irpex rosettiformis TaxID=378272 RepID=A0ACB8U9L2_9APHY|nr:major facilitator superfamily domain-containing protein [Irpex rosettiformis]